MRNFDFFEFTSVLIPGTVLMFGISRFFPNAWGPAFGSEFNASEFGLFVILAYIAGQLLQVIGQELEDKYWKRRGGWPTDALLRKDQDLLDEKQVKLVSGKIREFLNLECPDDLTTFTGKWFLVTRQVYAAVRRGGLNARVDLFNAHYGMFRGMVLSFTTVLLVSVVAMFRFFIRGGQLHWVLMLVIAAAIVCSYAGFLRYGKLYARELFLQFLEVKADDKPARDKASDGDEQD